FDAVLPTLASLFSCDIIIYHVWREERVSGIDLYLDAMQTDTIEPIPSLLISDLRGDPIHLIHQPGHYHSSIPLQQVTSIPLGQTSSNALIHLIVSGLA